VMMMDTSGTYLLRSEHRSFRCHARCVPTTISSQHLCLRLAPVGDAAGGSAEAEDDEYSQRKEVMKMPFGDRTGPMGMGPMTGRAAGYCTGFGRPGLAGSAPGYVRSYGRRSSAWPMWGYGFGRGRGRGFGRGRRWWGFHGYP